MTPPTEGQTEDAGALDREREIDELEFLVGNACSRAINLLMASSRDPNAIKEEMAFLGEKATRLACLLSEGSSSVGNH